MGKGGGGGEQGCVWLSSLPLMPPPGGCRLKTASVSAGLCVLSLQDIPTGADSCVTSLSCDSHRSLIVAGLGDGSIRVFDRRMALSEW